VWLWNVYEEEEEEEAGESVFSVGEPRKNVTAKDAIEGVCTLESFGTARGTIALDGCANEN